MNKQINAGPELSDEQIEAIAIELFPGVRMMNKQWCESVGRPFARAVLAAAAALAANVPEEEPEAELRPETTYEKSARWNWPDGRPDL